ncbi:ribonuclease HII [Patescibacteria group bacterium]|nr:ribonuclease HII [Patescibacteria group bacterium]
MRYPNFNEEKKLWKKGFKAVVGLDEAGRGPLAGPVLAAAVVITPGSKNKVSKLKIQDSKKLTAKKREEFYKILVGHPQIKWGIGRVSEKVIDKINILEATKLAMEKALRQVRTKLNKNIDYLILDGNFKIKSKIPQKSIIKADVKVFSCATASIIAKVSRDRIMLKYDKKYPKYDFKKHKGYPTKLHRKVLKKVGLCPIHRKSFSLK